MLSNQIPFFMHYWMNIYSYWSTHSTGHTNYDLWNVMTNYAIIVRCTQFTQSTLSLSFENWVHFCHSGAAYTVDTILENVTTCEITRERPSLLCMKIACPSVDQRRICGEKTVCSRGCNYVFNSKSDPEGCNYVFNSKSDQERHDLIIHQAERKAERKRESRKRGKTTDLDAAQVCSHVVTSCPMLRSVTLLQERNTIFAFIENRKTTKYGDRKDYWATEKK